MAATLPLLAFNDVYRVSQRYVPQPGCPAPGGGFAPDAEIRVSQFAQLVDDLRAQWGPRKKDSARGGSDDAGRDGLFLFAGDVFSPSVESSVTRGSHMVPVLNAIKIDAACVGNHDFDFGYPHMTKLVGATQFPWLLSNVIDDRTGEVPAPLHRFVVEERCGVRVGLVGLVEEDWIATIPSWPSHFRYRPMREVGLELSELLRDPKGPHRVDIIIALTHSRVPNDIKLANELGAVNRPAEIRGTHGVDLIIGGHDHIYYIGKGAAEWDGYAGARDKAGSEADKDCMIIKSGTDFRDLSSADLHLSPPDDSAVRRRVIERLTGKHHYVVPTSPANEQVHKLMERLLSTVTKTLKQPVCFSVTPFDARSEIVRTRESSLGNWTADVLLHAYDESLVDKKIVITKDPSYDRTKTISSGADAVIICGGTLRGDSQYGPGKIGLGDILEIFPFDDAVVCLEIDGEGIWQTMESALSRWPAQEGRFPIVSGLAVQWDATAPPMQRVKSIHLTLPGGEDEEMEDPVEFVDTKDGTRLEVRQTKLRLGEPVKNEKGGRVYRVITRQYMADGFDGFEALKGRPFLVDHETGTSISNILRSFLLGSAYIMRKKQLLEDRKALNEGEGAGEGERSEPADAAVPPSTSFTTAPAAGAHSNGAAGAANGASGLSPACEKYFGTKTPLVLEKHRARARASGSPAASPLKRKFPGELRANAGVVDVAVELPGHMPGGVENVKTGEEERASSLVEVKEVELPTKDALLDAAATGEAPGHMPGSTLNVVTGKSDEQMAAEAAADGNENWSFLKHHVVQHDWTFIKEAIYLAKHEHMSDVDRFKGDSMRRFRPDISSTPTPAATTGTATPIPALPGGEGQATLAPVTAGLECGEKCRVEIAELDNDLAIVSPLVDGRLKELSGAEA